jgi:hypothetical protein
MKKISTNKYHVKFAPATENGGAGLYILIRFDIEVAGVTLRACTLLEEKQNHLVQLE